MSASDLLLNGLSRLASDLIVETIKAVRDGNTPKQQAQMARVALAAVVSERASIEAARAAIKVKRKLTR